MRTERKLKDSSVTVLPTNVTQKLRARILELEDYIIELEEAMGISGVAPQFTRKLQPQERRLLGVLIKRSFVTRAMATTAMSRDRISYDRTGNNVDVRLHYVRKFLKSRNVVIHCEPREGWWIEPADRALLEAEFFATDATMTDDARDPRSPLMQQI